MAILGMGTDIVQIDRVEKSLAKSARFAERILTPDELAILNAHAQPHRYLAKRFAAKEAALKAFGTGLGNGASFQHIQVYSGENGQPLLSFSGYLATLCEERGVAHSHISISDEQEYATATVILESA